MFGFERRQRIRDLLDLMESCSDFNQFREYQLEYDKLMYEAYRRNRNYTRTIVSNNNLRNNNFIPFNPHDTFGD